MVRLPWQDAINPKFINRLLRPLVCPGVIPDTLAVSIFERSQRFKQRLSLMHQFQQRWGRQSTLQLPDVPIVYAQWVRSMEPAVASTISPSLDENSVNLSIQIQQTPPTVHPIMPQQFVNETVYLASTPSVIQAKFENPPTSPSISEAVRAKLPIVLASIPSVSLEAQPTKVSPKEPQQPTNEPLDSASTPFVVQANFVNSEDKANFITASSLLPVVKLSFAKEFITKDNKQPIVVSGVIQQDGFSQPLQDSEIQDSETFLKQRSPSELEKSPLKPSFPDMPAFSHPEAKPLVQATNVLTAPSSSPMSGLTQPLVLARRTSSPISSPYQESSLMPSPSVRQTSEQLPLATSQLLAQKPFTSTPSQQTPPIDVNRLTHEVERKMVRKLTVERERRGQQIWH